MVRLLKHRFEYIIIIFGILMSGCAAVKYTPREECALNGLELDYVRYTEGERRVRCKAPRTSFY